VLLAFPGHTVNRLRGRAGALQLLAFPGHAVNRLRRRADALRWRSGRLSALSPDAR